MSAVDTIRIIVAIVCAAAALIIGALSHQRADDQTKPQGLARAGIVLFYACTALALVAAVFDLPLELRLTTIGFAAVVTFVGLVRDSADVIRSRPESGPFGLVTRLLDRRRRR